MQIAKYSKWLRILSIIPILAGALTFIEAALPLDSQETYVVHKRSSYRPVKDRTTYTIYFQYIDDQFTEQIYNQLQEGDAVTLKITPFNQQIREIVRKSDGMVLPNDTKENWALLAIALFFVLCAFAWFSSIPFSETAARTLAVAVLFASIMLWKMF